MSHAAPASWPAPPLHASAPTGRVLGADVTASMLAVAAQQTSTIEPRIEWHETGADHLPFADGSFDAVVCQQGMQFFPDLPAAAREATRVTRAGGRVAATVWLPFFGSPYLEAQHHAIASLLGAEAGASYADAFSCSAEHLTAVFRAAGLRDVTTRDVITPITFHDVATYIPGHLSALPWGTALTQARATGLADATALMLERLGDRVQPDGSLTSPIGAALVSGTR
jgi:SAM-dependent methyltransferase